MPYIPKETKGVFKFLKPSNINVVGSYDSGCILGSTVTVDVMVEMPADLFRKQDYQNYIYFRKRAIYLAFVASIIGNDIAENKTFIGDNLRPFLKLRPSGKLNKKVDVVIHVSAQETSFKLNRFLPEKNSIRPGWYFNEKSVEGSKFTRQFIDLYNNLHGLLCKSIKNYILFFFLHSIFTAYSALQFSGIARSSNVEDKFRDRANNKRVSKFEGWYNLAENMVAPTRIG